MRLIPNLRHGKLWPATKHALLPWPGLDSGRVESASSVAVSGSGATSSATTDLGAGVAAIVGTGAGAVVVADTGGVAVVVASDVVGAFSFVLLLFIFSKLKMHLHSYGTVANRLGLPYLPQYRSASELWFLQPKPQRSRRCLRPPCLHTLRDRA